MPFVIDLNVMRTAWIGKDPHGNTDNDCLLLLSGIQKKCDKVIVTDEIDRRYLRLYDELGGKYPQGPSLLNCMKLYLRWKQVRKVDDSRLSSQLPRLRNESKIKDEDIEFARLTSVTGATLVTYDEPLIELGRELGFAAMKPSDARILLP